jgi:hypothetical protein
MAQREAHAVARCSFGSPRAADPAADTYIPLLI